MSDDEWTHLTLPPLEANAIERWITDRLIEGLADETDKDHEYLLAFGKLRPLPDDGAWRDKLPAWWPRREVLGQWHVEEPAGRYVFTNEPAEAAEARVESYRESLMRQMFGERKRGKEARAKAASVMFEQGRAFFPNEDLAKELGDWAGSLGTCYDENDRPLKPEPFVHLDDPLQPRIVRRAERYRRTIFGLDVRESRYLKADEVMLTTAHPAGGKDSTAVVFRAGDKITICDFEETPEGLKVSGKHPETGAIVEHFIPYDVPDPNGNVMARGCFDAWMRRKREGSGAVQSTGKSASIQRRLLEEREANDEG